MAFVNKTTSGALQLESRITIQKLEVLGQPFLNELHTIRISVKNNTSGQVRASCDRPRTALPLSNVVDVDLHRKVLVLGEELGKLSKRCVHDLLDDQDGRFIVCSLCEKETMSERNAKRRSWNDMHPFAATTIKPIPVQHPDRQQVQG